MTIAIRENFLTTDETADLARFARMFTGWDTQDKGIWYGRFVHVGHIDNVQVREQLLTIRKRVRAEIVGAYQLTRPLFADTLQVVRWPEGSDQRPHADSENPDGTPHPYAWRSYASILYLNDDFEGGQIYFPQLGLAPPIRAGMLVFFPGTLDYVHGVSTITRGVRYTVASFWTFDPSRQDGFPI